MKSIKMSWTWLLGTGNRKIFGRVNSPGELMEAGLQQIKDWDRLESAKTDTETFPDHMLVSHGTTHSHRGVMPAPVGDGRSTFLVLLVWCDPPLPLAGGLLKQNLLLAGAWHLCYLREASSASSASTNHSSGECSLYSRRAPPAAKTHSPAQHTLHWKNDVFLLTLFCF